MNLEHYQALYYAYAAALVGWFIVLCLRPKLWPVDVPRFPQPWREIGYALLAGLAVVGIGKLYTAGIRFPTSGFWGPVLESANQAVIFSPIFVLLWLRGQGWETVWLPKKAIPLRLLVGVILSLLTLFVFTVSKFGFTSYLDVLGNVYSWSNARVLTQVFFEDVAIALLMVRFTAAMRNAWLAAIVVGLLFAAGHIPPMLSQGASTKELTALLFDFALATGIVRVLQRAADIWWFWPIHFTMDMTQFVRLT